MSSDTPPSTFTALNVLQYNCAQCGNGVPASRVHPENERQFCCHGCENAYAMLHDEAHVRSRLEEAPNDSESDSTHPFAYMDHPAFQKRYINSTSMTNVVSCRLLLENMHCASCVLTIEKLHQFLPGVVDVRAQLSEGTALIVYQPESIPLSRIAQALHDLGYAPHPYEVDEAELKEKHELRRRVIDLGISGACAGNTMLIAVAMYAGFFSGMSAEFQILFRWTSVLLASISLFGPGAVFFQNAWRAIRTMTPHMDLPVAVGLTAGAVMGTINTLLQRGEVYFDSITVLIFLLLVGRFIQYRQQRRSIRQVSLLKALTPQSARRIIGEPAERKIEVVPVEAISVGNVLQVRVGDVVPADGVVIQGASLLDRSILTGESVGVPVKQGEQIAAGTTNLSAPLLIEVTHIAEQTKVAEIARLVEAGIRGKTPIVQLANAIGGYFVVIVLSLALITFCLWINSGVETAVNNAMALLVVACPCALGLATPLTIAIAQGRAAREKILIKSGDVFERIQKPGDLWLDKTGTLTVGRPRLHDWTGDESLMPAVIELERGSLHPIAETLIRELTATTKTTSKEIVLSEITTVPGIGLHALHAGERVGIGSEKLVEALSANMAPTFASKLAEYHNSGWTGLVVIKGDDVVAVCAVGDSIRHDSASTVASLKQQGWRVGILSGDHQTVVSRVAAQLGIEAQRAIGEVTPEQKLERIRERGSVHETVMVGDGVNDSAALAAASVGIAVHGGATVSLEAADVYVNRPGLSPILNLFRGVKQTLRTVHLNFAVSLGYNLLAASLAMAGMIHPILAAVLMPISSLSVLAIAAANPAFRGSGDSQGASS